MRVYERRAGGPLHVEWFPNGQRKQRTLKYMTGRTIADKSEATRIANEMADELEQSHYRDMRTALYGVDPHKNLAQLLGRLHDQKEKGWSKHYARHQRRFRDFWLRKLGADTRLIYINAAMVEAAASAAADDNDWSAKTHGHYLNYLVNAFKYAEQKLKWIEPRHNLSGVDIPKPDSVGKPYTRAEVQKLVPELGRQDIRAEWLARVLWQTGRRLSAARTLPKSAVAVRDDHSVIEWPQETDKARQRGTTSVIVGRAHELTKELAGRPGAYMLGRRVPHEGTVQRWMVQAEEKAGVEHKPHRLWHGIKRRYSDRTEGMKSRAAQSGTTEQTLRRKYDPEDDLKAKLAVAKKLARELGEL